ncbi:MAG: glycosyltransferase family 2 protein [Clostridia bacterium]|nr:glycosyltransferase family 2 protein [Clostridia bacterium]
MEENKKLVTILVPAYNEEEVLHMLYERLETLMDDNRAYDFEVLLVNDGSKDKTLQIMQELREKDKRINYLNLSRNFGKETAMIAGLDYCKGDAVIIIDADLQDPPELIPELLKYWEEGYDDVYAKRKSRQGESFLKKFTSKMYYKVLQAFTKIEIQKDTGDFRLLDRRCVEALKAMRESQRYTKGLFSWIGYNKKEVLYDRDPRAAGKTKWNYGKLINLSIDGITSFTTSPLRWAAGIGILVSFVAFIYMIVIIVKTIVSGVDVPGYASTMVVILFLGGIQLIFLGVIGEYLGRAFNEGKHRPLYFIERYNEEKETNANLNKSKFDN